MVKSNDSFTIHTTQSHTRVQNMISKSLLVKCGVPQGSCLDPSLLYINDLLNASKFDMTLFADDTLMMLADKSPILLQQKVNEQIKSIDLWLCINKLSLNYEKKNNFIVFLQNRKNS